MQSINIFLLLAFLVGKIHHIKSKDAGGFCAESATVPMHFTMEDPSKYHFAYSSLQIFTELEVPCDGILVEWQFLTKSKVVTGLHLGVFRPILNGDEKSPRDIQSFQLIGENYLRALATPETGQRSWVYYPVVNEPITVQKGDYLGFFYDSFSTTTDLLAISSMGRYDVRDKNLKPTFVFMKDQSHISLNSKFILTNVLNFLKKNM